jgi:prepilin-type N-terminal cleavage/methylation domain-containing protein/prepilin-type processing-associated H-X9-DG protein
MRHNAPRHAFTLIELLVVVAIIALLISILLPSLSQAKDQAITVVCKTRLRELYHGHALYAGDNKGLFPDYDAWLWPRWSVVSTWTPTDSSKWIEGGEIYRYIKNKETYFCPKDDKQRVRGSGVESIGSGGIRGEVPIHSYVRAIEPHMYAVQRLRPDWPQGDQWGSTVHYIDPAQLTSGVFTPPIGNRQHAGNNFHQFPRGVPMAARIVLLFEEHPGFGFGDYAKWQLNDGWSSKINTSVDFMATRHRKQGHVVFWDGHLELSDSARFNRYPTDDYARQYILGGPIPNRPPR